ncbi:unnamed protein product [Vicia faba]|uniref:Uncharacterized protein n=1 Tax=Vicia faba TaxID=3906 RepID=A0AAV0Z340_VICFA|nr:unnamed protein product [Vicia faba]
MYQQKTEGILLMCALFWVDRNNGIMELCKKFPFMINRSIIFFCIFCHVGAYFLELKWAHQDHISHVRPGSSFVSVDTLLYDFLLFRYIKIGLYQLPFNNLEYKTYFLVEKQPSTLKQLLSFVSDLAVQINNANCTKLNKVTM